MYETDLTKGVYRLEDFCNALKDNNCIIDDRVFINWLYLVNSSLYDSVKFIIFNKMGELTYGQWIACNHDLVITDYTKRAASDASIKGIKTSQNYALADKIIRNTYRTLLSRGQKGCFIYCEDKQLQSYLKNRLMRLNKQEF